MINSRTQTTKLDKSKQLMSSTQDVEDIKPTAHWCISTTLFQTVEALTVSRHKHTNTHVGSICNYTITTFHYTRVHLKNHFCNIQNCIFLILSKNDEILGKT